MIRIAILCADNTDAAKIKNAITGGALACGCDCETSRFATAADFINSKHIGHDLIIMDIDMPYVLGMDGIDVATHIRGLDKSVAILFISEDAGAALIGYELEIIDYLVKPFDKSFDARIARAVERVAAHAQRKIAVQTEGVTRYIGVRDIYYIEVRDHFLMIHMRDETIRLRGKLSELEKQLTGGGFFRTFKSVLVNLDHLELVTADGAVIAGHAIPVSRDRRRALLAAIGTNGRNRT